MGMNNTAYFFYGVEIFGNSKDLENLEDILDKDENFEVIFLGWWDPPHNHGRYFLAFKKSRLTGEASPIWDELPLFDDTELQRFCLDYKLKFNGWPQWWFGSCWCV